MKSLITSYRGNEIKFSQFVEKVNLEINRLRISKSFANAATNISRDNLSIQYILSG